MDPNAPFTVVKESPALALVGAHNGSGTVVAVKATPMAIAKAKVCGVGMVVVRHSTQFGSASHPSSQPLALSGQQATVQRLPATVGLTLFVMWSLVRSDWLDALSLIMCLFVGRLHMDWYSEGVRGA